VSVAGNIVVETLTVDGVPTAVRDGRTTRADLAATIRELLDDVWTHIRGRDDLVPGPSVVLYRGDFGEGLSDIEVGVQVERSFDGVSVSGVRCSVLPAGRVARALHLGPYDQMASTYDAITAWARDSAHTFAGPSWEVYGDWDDDPAKLRTEIYFLLTPP
jgi:effector-binding domain-containing protein